MSAHILDGKKIAEEIKESVKEQIRCLKKTHSQSPKLVALQVREDPAFSVYIKSQERFANDVGIEYKCQKLDSHSSQNGVRKTIVGLNCEDTVSGIILQAPLPEKFDSMELISSISPQKDVEGIHPENKGKLLLRNYDITPPTASAVMELIYLSGIKLRGKETVVIGHSRVVGKPVAMLLLDKFATVTVCHIGTSERGNLEEHIRRAEVLVVAAGKANLVKGQWIKKGAIVIDAGINKIGDKIVGDVEFDEAKERASYITPVPGGVGPVTTAVLMRNCVTLFKLQRGIK